MSTLPTSLADTVIDISNLSDPVRLEVEGLLPNFSRMIRTTSTPNVIQSIVASILVTDVFHIYYFGLDEEHTDYLRRMEDHMTLIGKPSANRISLGDLFLRCFTLALPVKANEWRSTTLSIIRQSPTPDFQNHAMGLSRRTHDRINRILDELTGTGTNGTRDKGLQSVLDQSIDLSQAFRVQRAQLIVHLPATMPDSRLAFDSEIMEDITGEDDEVLEGEDVKCVIFPYVLKLGDETGDNVSSIQCRCKAPAALGTNRYMLRHTYGMSSLKPKYVVIETELGRRYAGVGDHGGLGSLDAEPSGSTI